MDLNSFKKNIAKEAESAGFKHWELFFSKEAALKVSIFEANLNEYKNSTSEGVSFRGIYNNKIGFSYSEELSEASAKFLVESSKANAQIMEECETSDIFNEQSTYKEIDEFNENIPNSVKLIDLGKKLEDVAFTYSDEIASVNYCMTGYNENHIAIFNSKGLDLNHKSNVNFAYVSSIAKNNDDIKTNAAFWCGKNIDELNVKEVGEESSSGAINMLGATPIKSGDYKILLKNEVAADILECFAQVFYGENIFKGLSLLKDKKGSKISSDIINLIDDGTLKDGFATSPFDCEGIACKKNIIIENGVLNKFLCDTKYSIKLKEEKTGNGFKSSFKSDIKTSTTNFYIENGIKSKENIIADIKDGVYITEVDGLHAGTNVVSGDFSLSAQGYLIDNSEIKYPVEQITISGNFYNLLNDIIDVGDDLKFSMSAIGSPCLYIKSLYVSGL